MATRSSPFASIVGITLLVACTSSHHDKPCPTTQPSFRIELTASDGPLPPDTVLTVKYSGTRMEAYSLVHGGPSNSDVCCRPASPTNAALPDVPCGIPPVVTMEASVTTPMRDAGHVRDAAVASPGRADAASIADAAVATSDASLHAVSRDAGSFVDAARPQRDASVEASSRAGSDAVAPQTAGPEAIVCDLWTYGYARVKVTGAGYAKLSALIDDQSVPDSRCQNGETVDHRLVLTHEDGGLLR